MEERILKSIGVGVFEFGSGRESSAEDSKVKTFVFKSFFYKISRVLTFRICIHGKHNLFKVFPVFAKSMIKILDPDSFLWLLFKDRQ